MRIGLLSALALVLVFAISGCESVTVQTPNGTLDPQYLAAAQTFVGDYSASANALFSANQGEVRVSLEGSKLILSSTMDLLGPGCHSAVGELQSFHVDTDNDGKISAINANFAFNSGNCMIDGRDVTFHWNKTIFGGNAFEVSILIAHYHSNGHVSVGRTRIWDLNKLD